MKNKAAQSLGRRGGQETAKKGKDYYSLIGKLGAVKRWGKKVPLKLGDVVSSTESVYCDPRDVGIAQLRLDELGHVVVVQGRWYKFPPDKGTCPFCNHTGSDYGHVRKHLPEKLFEGWRNR